MITAIDKNTALVLIDLQKGISASGVDLSEVISSSVLLIDAFRNANLPIVYVNVIPSGAWQRSRKEGIPAQSTDVNSYPPEFSELMEEVKTQPSDIFITKQSWNAFYETALHEELKKHNITNIVLAGVSTSAGVEGTARAASERGYNISFAIDAMKDRNPEAHQNSINLVFPRLGEQGTAAEIVEKLISSR